jgi:hypothetical protein
MLNEGLVEIHIIEIAIVGFRFDEIQNTFITIMSFTILSVFKICKASAESCLNRVLF